MRRRTVAHPITKGPWPGGSKNPHIDPLELKRRRDKELAPKKDVKK